MKQLLPSSDRRQICSADGKSIFMLSVMFCEGIQVPALPVVRLLHQEEAHPQGSLWQVWLDK